MKVLQCVRRGLSIAAILAWSICQQAIAQTYSITDLGTLPSFNSSEANGVNPSGQVAGISSNTVSGIDHAFVWSNGTMQDLGTLGFTSSSALDINALGQAIGNLYNDPASPHTFIWTSDTGLTDIHDNSTGFSSSVASSINGLGQIVGQLTNDGGDTGHAFLWSSGTGITDLGVMPGLTSSSASDINDLGQVVGSSSPDTGATKGFLWTSDGGFTDLGTLPGFANTDAGAINASTQVVGEASNDRGPVHGFLWTGSGGMTDLGTLSGFSSLHPSAINAGGVVVGEASNDPAPGVAFIWQNGVITDLNTLIPSGSGWFLQRANGMNDAGQIVGKGTIGGQSHAFLLTPIS